MVTDNKEIKCATCERGFIPTRSDAQYCSSACRQKAHRKNKPKVNTGLALRSELTPKQERFVEEYLVDRNATQAAIRAGYSEKSAHDQGSRLLRLVEVQETLRARGKAALARLEVTEDMVLQALAVIAFSNLGDYVEWDESAGSLVVRPSAQIPKHLMAAIESVEDQVITTTNKDGTRSYSRHKQKIKLHPKLPALQLLAEYLGLTDTMTPKVTVHLITGIDRTPLPVDVEAEPVVENPPGNRASGP